MNRPSADNVPSAPAGELIEVAPTANAELEQCLAAVESRLSRLADALMQRDLPAIDLESSELHRSLAHAVEHFSKQARNGPIPAALRRRLASTSGNVAAQRESFARATAALDRAIDVLLPRETPALYGAHGGRTRQTLGGVIQA